MWLMLVSRDFAQKAVQFGEPRFRRHMFVEPDGPRARLAVAIEKLGDSRGPVRSPARVEIIDRLAADLPECRNVRAQGRRSRREGFGERIQVQREPMPDAATGVALRNHIARSR